jgi:hypothetical protein
LRQDFKLGGLKDGFEFFRDSVAIHFPQPQSVDDVFGYRHVRPQRVALEDHRHFALLGRQGARLRRYHPVADMDFAVGRLKKSGDQAQRRGLAAARGAQQADQLPVVDPQRDIIYDRQRSKSLGQATQFNGRQSLHSLLSSARILAPPNPRHRR